ncbi:MAG: hypothetical protein AB1782_05455 [Cyanobacteriota bacterium]
MTEAQPQNQQIQHKKSSYTYLNHIIDKCVFNFIAGFIVAASIAIIIGLNLTGIDAKACIPLILFLIVVSGFAYAFFGIGISCSSTKQENFNITLLPAFGATIASTFTYMFPMFFLQVLLNFTIFLLPKYDAILKAYKPTPKFSHTLLVKKFCDTSSTDICFFHSQFGIITSQFLDVLLLFVGLSVIFSIINCVVAFFKISGK